MEKTVQIKHIFNNTDITKLYQVVSEIAILADDAQVEKQTKTELILKRIWNLPKAVSKLLNINNKIPYHQIVDIDLPNDRFLCQTTVKIKQYTLKVAILYKSSAEDVICKGKIIINGVKNISLRQLAVNMTKNEFKACRKHEEKIMKQKNKTLLS
tara:strand:+ start:653 stop:1117 length:465 start_codon:yes stop_codon:yes gene_type:complete